MDWKEWLMDVTHGDSPPCFVPYERDTGDIVLGMSLITDQCPGELVGVIHAGGQQAAEEYCTANPQWHQQFAKAASAEAGE